jgi:nucleotide-binding universal stress UspA family protein
MKTILAPVDFSGISDAVIAEASGLARALDARIVLFSVIQPPVVLGEYAPLMENIAEINAAGEKSASRHFAKIEEKLRGEGLNVSSEHAIGSPVTLIVEQAEKVGADYIVMGSHGHTAFYDLLVGSTTHGVLTRSKCPVIIVPAKESPGAKGKKKARR